MLINIEYTSANGDKYIINGGAPDLFDDLSHRGMFSIEKPADNITFTYHIGISHQLWEACWNLKKGSVLDEEKVKDVYIEKIKRLIDAGKEEYIDVTLTPVNTPKSIKDAIEKLKQTG